MKFRNQKPLTVRKSSLWLLLLLVLSLGGDYSPNGTTLIVEGAMSSSTQDGQALGPTSSTWQDVQIASVTSHADPAVAVDSNGYLYAVHRVTVSGDPLPYRLYVYRSTDGGSSWYLYKSRLKPYQMLNPDIAVDLHTNKVYIVYESIIVEPLYDNHNIWCWRVTDDDVRAVDTDGNDDRDPSIAIEYVFGSQNNIFIAYERRPSYDDRDLHVAKSTDHGYTWDNNWHVRGNEIVAWNPFPVFPIYDKNVHTQVDIAVDSKGFVFVTFAWGEDYGELENIYVDIGYRVFPSWSLVKAYDGSQSYESTHPQIAVSRDSSQTTRVVIVFEKETSSAESNIKASYSSNGGSSFSSVTVCSASTDDTRPIVTAPGMSTSSNTVGYFYLVYKKGTDYIVERADWLTLGDWSCYHDTLITVGSSTPRAFGITTREDNKPVIVYLDGTSPNLKAGGDFVTFFAPPLVFPGVNALMNNNTPLLDWSSVVGATSYQVEVYNANTDIRALIKYPTESFYTVQTPLPDTEYYWYVYPRTSSGDLGPKSSTRYFTIDTDSPPTLTLVAPAHNSYINDSTPSLDWNPVSGSLEQYQVQWDDNGDFSSPGSAEISVQNTVHETPTLTDGYWYWRVRAQDEAGNWGLWSTRWSFHMDTTAPDVPTLVSPINGITTGDNTPLLDWNAASSSGASVDQYQVQWDDNSGFDSPDSIDILVPATSHEAPVLADDDWYWRVRAHDEAGNWGSWSSSSQRFRVDTTGPLSPTLLAPTNGTHTRNSMPILDWNPAPTAVRYQMQMNDSSGIKPDKYTTDSSFTPPSAWPDETYSWRVRAKDADNNWGSWTSVWYFTIDTISPLKPALVSPANGSYTNNTPTFDWNPVSDAVGYQLQVKDSLGSIRTKYIPNSSHTTANPNSDGTYIWRVRAQDQASNWSPWSKQRVFTIDTINPAIPRLGSPVYGKVITNSTPTFKWKKMNDTVDYWIELDISPLFSTPIINTTTTNTFYTLIFPLGESTFYWRIRAKDEANNWGIYCKPWSFTIDKTPPPAATISTPSDGTILPNLPLLNWSVSPDAVGFRLEIDNSSASFNSLVINKSLSTTSYRPVLPDGTYYWRILTKDAAGNVAFSYSAVWDFTIDRTGPNAPILSLPNDEANVAVKTPHLVWNAVSDAAWYQIQVDNSPRFSQPEVDNITTNAFYTTSSLPDGTYYWRVRSNDTLGHWGKTSMVWSFTVSTTGSPAPRLFTPVNDALLTDNTPLLNWSEHVGTVEYLVNTRLLGASSLSINTTTTDTFYTPTALVDGVYYWRVRGKDTGGTWGAWSTPWSFTVSTIVPIPDLQSPADGTTLKENTPQLDWSTVFSAVDYQLQLDNNSAFSSTEVDITTTSPSHTTSTLPDSLYFWRVRAKNSAGTWSNWSNVCSFTVKTSLIAPNLIFPVDGAIVPKTTPSLYWMAVEGTMEYQVRIATSYAFSSPMNDISTINTTYNITTILPESIYFWQVRSKDLGSNWGAWSRIWNFTVSITGLAAPVLTSPTENSILTDATPQFEWTSIPNISEYLVQVATSNEFNSPMINVKTTTNSYTPSVSLVDGTYFWRVRAINTTSIQGPWSSVIGFNIDTSVTTTTTTTTTKTTTTTTTTGAGSFLNMLGVFLSIGMIVLIARKRRK